MSAGKTKDISQCNTRRVQRDYKLPLTFLGGTPEHEDKLLSFCYNGIMFCKHVYEIVRQEICPDCGRDTHETDWNLVADQHKEWITSGKAVAQGWWSI